MFGERRMKSSSLRSVPFHAQKWRSDASIDSGTHGAHLSCKIHISRDFETFQGTPSDRGVFEVAVVVIEADFEPLQWDTLKGVGAAERAWGYPRYDCGCRDSLGEGNRLVRPRSGRKVAKCQLPAKTSELQTRNSPALRDTLRPRPCH